MRTASVGPLMVGVPLHIAAMDHLFKFPVSDLWCQDKISWRDGRSVTQPQHDCEIRPECIITKAARLKSELNETKGENLLVLVDFKWCYYYYPTSAFELDSTAG